MSQLHQKTYYGNIDFNVPNNSHTQVFYALREHCEATGVTKPRVLEIGCSVGYFSHALRDNGVYVYGVEPFSREAADNGLVDDFFHGTVEEFVRAAGATEPDLLQSFDAVILGDVLEHLPDPEKTLRDLTPYLKPEGIFIASVPNITHIGIRRMLEHGEWIYQKYGLLDSTHIRFFTWRSLRELFIRAGFGISRRFDVRVPEAHVYPSSEAMAHQNAPLNPDDHVFQFVVSASRQALAAEAFTDSLPRKVLLLSADPLSHRTQLRLCEPLAAYAAAVGGRLRIAQHCPSDSLRWADVLVTHMLPLPDTLEAIREARARGLAVVYDVDEALTASPAWRDDPFFLTDKLLMQQLMATAHRVTCPTQALEKQLRLYADAISIVPNALIGPAPAHSLSVSHEGQDCTLVVASAEAGLTDMLLEALCAVRADMPGLELVCIGPVSNALADLATRRYDRCDPLQYNNILMGIKNGIGLIPLDNSSFSACGSPLKWHQYTACGLVTVASDVPPYSQCMDNDQNGLLVPDDPEAWRRAILRLAGDDKLRQLLLTRAIRVWQKTGSPSIAVNAWKKVFTGLPRPMKQR